jgi:hypothetical protein
MSICHYNIGNYFFEVDNDQHQTNINFQSMMQKQKTQDVLDFPNSLGYLIKTERQCGSWGSQQQQTAAKTILASNKIC